MAGLSLILFIGSLASAFVWGKSGNPYDPDYAKRNIAFLVAFAALFLGVFVSHFGDARIVHENYAECVRENMLPYVKMNCHEPFAFLLWLKPVLYGLVVAILDGLLFYFMSKPH